MEKIPRSGVIAFLARMIYLFNHWVYRTFWQSITIARICSKISNAAYDYRYREGFDTAIDRFLADYRKAKALERQYREYDG